jgi:REP element-mobilizing transposase RayT
MAESWQNRKRPHYKIRPAIARPTIVFLTLCTANRHPILANDIAHRAIVSAWQAASAWRVGRYVIMPDHAHLFVTPGQPELPLVNWIK